MEKAIRSVVRNKRTTPAEQFNACLRVLGDSRGVALFANLWDSQREHLEVVIANELLKFCEQEQYNHDESAAFRKGLNTLPKFFEKCSQELKLNDMQKKQAVKQ